VHRLAKTWAVRDCREEKRVGGSRCLMSTTYICSLLRGIFQLVKSRDKTTFDKLSELMASDANSERYRKRLSAAKPPALPFLGTPNDQRNVRSYPTESIPPRPRWPRLRRAAPERLDVY